MSLPTLEEIERAERKRALEMPLASMTVGELRDVMIGETSVQVRRLAVTYFENAVGMETLREEVMRQAQRMTGMYSVDNAVGGL